MYTCLSLFKVKNWCVKIVLLGVTETTSFYVVAENRPDKTQLKKIKQIFPKLSYSTLG
jgi:hypothetical protein